MIAQRSATADTANQDDDEDGEYGSDIGEEEGEDEEAIESDD